MNKQSKFKVSGILIIFALLLISTPTSVVHSQTGGEYCGQFQRLDAGTRGFPAFVPFGSENNPSEWWIIGTLNQMLPVTSTGEEIPPNYGQYLRIWYPEFDSYSDTNQYLISISSYEFVDTCAPAVTPILDFYVDNTTLYAGECTTLYWNTNSVYQQVFLDSTNGPVVSNDGHAPASGSAVVCPLTDTTYRLTGAYDIIQDYKDITVYVIQPTSTPIPPTATRIPTKTPIPLTSTPIPQSTATISILFESPTPLIKTPSLSITEVQINPSTIKQYERTVLRIKINVGSTDNYNYWDSFAYSGEVVIKSSDGQMVGDVTTLINGKNASFHSTNSAGEVEINARVSFNEPIKNGLMEVFIYTNDEPKQTLVYTLPINISNQELEIPQCAITIVDKLAIGLSISDQTKAALALTRFSGEVTSCEDMSCATKLIIDYVQDVAVESIYKEPGGILIAIKDAVQGQDSLKVCKRPSLWLYSILDEAIRSGIPINMRAVHSPALITIENKAGQQSGFLDKTKPITEIDGSIAFLYEESQYIYFPAQNVNTKLVGTGNGVMSVDIINVQGNQVIDTSYVDVPVTTKLIASVDSTETTTSMTVADGNTTKTIEPDYAIVQEIPENTQTTKSNNPIWNFIAILAVIFAVLIYSTRNRAKK
jgi:hypothetical protein